MVKGRVLVIDDEAEVRRSVSAGLTQAGCSVVACPDGYSAIRELARGAFDYLVAAVFLPDIDGLKIAKAARALHPNLPVAVISGFGDWKLRQAVLAEPNTAYLDKPFKIGQLVQALEKLTPGTKAGAPLPKADEPETDSPARACLLIRVPEHERSLAVFHQLRGMDGVQACEAVVGDVDIILLAQAPSADGIRAFTEKVRAIPGVEIASASPVERPELDPDVRPFVEACRREAKAGPQGETASYLLVDVDPHLIRRVFATILFLDNVVSCDVIAGGARLIALVAGDDAGVPIRRAVERLSRMDGVLRVREARIIQMADDGA